jgi:DNA-binding response OmpR family regulator
MGSSCQPLSGRSILVVEDEPLIAFDLAHAFADAGANVLTAASGQEALTLADTSALSAAVLDYMLGDDDVTAFYQHLAGRGIPCMFYTGCDSLDGIDRAATVVSKPASNDLLVARLSSLLPPRASAPRAA